MGYIKLRKKLLTLLHNELPANLTYHKAEHTLEVLSCVIKALRRSKIKGHEAELIKIAVLAHDIGFTKTYSNHEIKGTELVSPMMRQEGYTQKDIDTVCSLIMITQVPQKAVTLAEQIICDADLDYLGGHNFYEISESLFTEWKAYGIISDDRRSYDKIQLKFLKSHHYFTPYSIKHRSKEKEKRIREIEEKLMR